MLSAKFAQNEQQNMVYENSILFYFSCCDIGCHWKSHEEILWNHKNAPINKLLVQFLFINLSQFCCCCFQMNQFWRYADVTMESRMVQRRCQRHQYVQ